LFVLTGAGLSAGSGIPTFRGKGGGIWKNHQLLKYAFAETFEKDPEGMCLVHEAARTMVDGLRPNAGHAAIHELSRDREVCLFTQNADGYHQRAGDRAMEIHGTLHALRCSRCVHRTEAPFGCHIGSFACPACGGWMRHDVVWFGEPVRHVDELVDALETCDAVLLVGTSGLVTDTKGIAQYARKRRVPVVEVNPALLTPATFWTTVTIREPAETVLPNLVS
jgi:NAD-dependent deacetylase